MIPAWIDGALVPVEKLEVHRRGLLHKAVSVFLVCGDALLIQQRAPGKYHSPRQWANSCCTHPAWGEAPADCAARRMGEELGVTGLDLVPRGQVEYRAEVGGGLVEHERVDLFVARTASRPAVDPDPAEVMATDWLTLGELRARVAADPESFTPWLRIYLARDAAQIFGPGWPG